MIAGSACKLCSASGEHRTNDGVGIEVGEGALVEVGRIATEGGTATATVGGGAVGAGWVGEAVGGGGSGSAAGRGGWEVQDSSRLPISRQISLNFQVRGRFVWAGYSGIRAIISRVIISVKTDFEQGLR